MILSTDSFTLNHAPIRDNDGIVSYQVSSIYQAGITTVRVLLPDNMSAVQRYLYVLPVQPDLQTKYGDGLVELMKQDLHNRYSMIAIAPSFSDSPWFVDHPTDAAIRQESYMLHVVLPLVEYYHPCHAPKRLLVGFSKSGYGSMSLLLRYPDIFTAASVWDASMLRDKPLSDIFARIVGSMENYENYRISTLLSSRGEHFRNRKRIALLGYDILREDMTQAHLLMDRLKIPHFFVDGPQRAHRWDSGWLDEAVRLLDIMAHAAL